MNCKLEQAWWLIVYTMPKSEKKVRESLKRQNIECFLPTQIVKKKWRDRVKTLEVPLFPNYIFVKLPIRKRFIVFSTPGIVKYLTMDKQPVILSEEEIVNIRKMQSLPKNVSMEKLEVFGTKAKIFGGVFDGLEGTLVKNANKYWLDIKLKHINQSLIVEITDFTIEMVA